jgi:hypothetical protein
VSVASQHGQIIVNLLESDIDHSQPENHPLREYNMPVPEHFPG